jgi:hypothetical protein
MAEQQFKFPDEVDSVNPTKTAEAVDNIEIEVVNDAPPEDQNRKPLPEKQVQELEADDLDAYDDKVKNRLSQMKKVWHDERRSKEAAIREREEAVRFAEAKDREIKELRAYLGRGEKLFADEVAKTVSHELADAKAKLKQAYEAGDAELIADAHEALTDAKVKAREIQRMRPPLQEENFGVQTKEAQQPQQRAQTPTVDAKAEAWRTKNTWFGVDQKMTGFALGLHQELVEAGVDPRSDDYYEKVNTAMQKTFPDRFEFEGGSGQTEAQDKAPAREKPPAVVASVSRTTSPKRIRLTTSQSAIAKRLGLTPEAYAREMIKLENING